jgi:hypothetical protein
MLLTPTHSEWFHEDAPHLSAMNSLRATIARLERKHPGSIPGLRSYPTLLIGSDYSDSTKEPIPVTSLLITNIESIGPWDCHRLRLRERYLPEQRRMSYKALNGRHRRTALMPFLAVANQVPGLLVTIAMDKKVAAIFESDSSDTSEQSTRHLLFEGWKPAPIERAMRTIHFASALCVGQLRRSRRLAVHRPRRNRCERTEAPSVLPEPQSDRLKLHE